MTLTYLGPTVGAGDLSVPAAGVELDPLLAEAVVLLRASQFTGADGDDWVNEGSGGSTYDAVADPASIAGGPHYVTVPEPGFEMGGSGDPPNYQVPNGAAIDADTGSFTVAARILYIGPDEAFAPIVAKLTGTFGVDAAGWGIFTGTFSGGGQPGVAFVVSGGTPTLAYAPSLDELVADTEYLLVGRVDRAGDTIDLFVDSVEVASAAAAGVPDVTSANPIIMGRSTTAEQVGRDYAYWDRALTNTEITVDVPAALG